MKVSKIFLCLTNHFSGERIAQAIEYPPGDWGRNSLPPPPRKRKRNQILSALALKGKDTTAAV